MNYHSKPKCSLQNESSRIVGKMSKTYYVRECSSGVGGMERKFHEKGNFGSLVWEKW